MDKRVVLLQPDILSIVRIDGMSADVEKSWQINNTLPSAFVQFLSDNNRSLYSLLLDLPDEECQLEEFSSAERKSAGKTRISKKDRKYLLKRLKKKVFPDALLSCVFEASIDGNTKSMVSGFNKSPVLQALIDQLQESSIMLCSIHSPLTILPGICKQQSIDNGSQLLVIRTGNNRIRYVACIDGFVFFNRCIDVIGSTYEETINALRSSIDETLVYLNRQQTNNWTAPHITLFGVPNEDALSESLGSIVDSEAATGLQFLFSEEQSGDTSLPAFEQAMVLRAFWEIHGYAGKVQRKFYTQHKVRSVSLALAASGVIGAISSVAVAQKVEGLYESLATDYTRSLSVTPDTSQERSREEPSNEYSVEAVRQALATAKLINMQAQQSPLDLLSEIGLMVSAESSISVNSISWEKQDSLDSQSLGRLLKQTQGSTPVTLDELFSATLTGTVDGRPEQALGVFESFVASLRRTNGDPNVIVIEVPFGLGGDKKTGELAFDDGNFTIEISHSGEPR